MPMFLEYADGSPAAGTDIILIKRPGGSTLRLPLASVLTYIEANIDASPPGGSSGQIQYNNAGALGGFTVGGDGTLNTGTGSLIVTKTNGVSFAASATTDTTNAANIASGVLGAARGGAGTVNGLLKANGSGVVSAASSGTDYAPATSGSSILYGNGSGGFSGVTIGSGLSFVGGALSATGGGTVTHTAGALTSGQLIVGNGSDDLKVGNLSGDVTTSGGTATTIADDAVSYAKLQNVSAASKLLGRGDSGAGDPQEITLGSNLSMSGTTLNATGAGLEITDGYWSPLTNGDPASPELVFTNGDVIMMWIETP